VHALIRQNRKTDRLLGITGQPEFIRRSHHSIGKEPL
jgi:hypothetical protein